jgi:hypothetical protein
MLVPGMLALASRADAYVYWTNANNTIGRATLDGTTDVNQSFISGAADSPYGIAVSKSGRILWTNLVDGNPGTGTIGLANADGTGVNPDFITGASSPYAVAVGGGRVYWTNTLSNTTGTIGRATLTGKGVNQRFIPKAGSSFGVAVDPNYVYWSNLPDGTIGRANLNGTDVNPRFITATGGSPLGLAVTATDIYWSSVGQTSETVTIFRASLDDPNIPQSLVTDLPGTSFGVAVGPSNLYWTSFGPPDIEWVGRANLDGTSPNPGFIGASSPTGVGVDAGGATCGGSDATIIGTGRPDKLRGTKGDDVIAAMGGDDAVAGRGGDDLVCGGGGDDVLRGKGGGDELRGGGGRDELRGGGGSDKCRGGRGRDGKHHC